MKLLRFGIFANEFGITNLGQKLGVSDWAVRKWMRGDGAPRTDRIITIVKMMDNKITVQEIYKECTRNK